MKNILIFHPTLMDHVTGSSETLLREIAKILLESKQFNLALAYGTKNQLLEELNAFSECQLLPFYYENISGTPGSRILGMAPALPKLIESAKPDLIISLISEPFQKTIKQIPSSIPLILISPFGEFGTNGNLRELYVSGHNNLAKLKKLGVIGATQFFNPIPVPEFNLSKSIDNIEKDSLIFGRVGRPDEFIFDPISIYAFKMLEDKYGNKVKYIYVNPSATCVELVEKLNIKNIEFKHWLSKAELHNLYSSIDVLAHARRDGETLGVAIGEAMLFQNPIISHRTQHFNEHLFLIREPYGRSCELGDVNGYFSAMESFFKDRHKLGTLGSAARDFAIECFDYKRISCQIINDCISATNPLSEKQLIKSTIKITLYNLLRRIKYSYYASIVKNLS